MALTSLVGEREFRKVRQTGQVVRHPLFTLRIAPYRPRYGEQWRPRAIVGIVVSKKTLARAVRRNRVRRRVREALRTLPMLPPCRAMILPTPAVLSVPFDQLQEALAEALAKGALKAKTAPRNQKATGRVPGAVEKAEKQKP